MPELESRIAMMEHAAAHVDMNKMTDEELLAHAGMFPMFSKGRYAAVLTLVGRYPSAMPIVKVDPERGRP